MSISLHQLSLCKYLREFSCFDMVTLYSCRPPTTSQTVIHGTQLRSRTFASIEPIIPQALDLLLDKLQANEDAKVMRSAVSQLRNFKDSSSEVKQPKFSSRL